MCPLAKVEGLSRPPNFDQWTQLWAGQIPNVLTFATLQADLRPIEAQFGGFCDPERATDGWRRDICVLTATPEGLLNHFEELGVLSHHLV